MAVNVLWLHINSTYSVNVVHMTASANIASQMKLSDIPMFLEAVATKFVILDGYHEKYGEVFMNVFSFK